LAIYIHIYLLFVYIYLNISSNGVNSFMSIDCRRFVS